jgi:hypothetical protein
MYARVAAILFIIMAIAAEFSTGVLGLDVVEPGDATATANNLIDAKSEFRVGIIGHLVVLFMDIGVAVLLYELLKPVNKTLSLVAATFRLIMVAMRGINLLTHFVALTLVSGADYLRAFETDQLHALVLLSLTAFEDGILIDFIFFSFHLLFLGYLVFKSGYLPRLIGVWLMIACLGYLINSFTRLGFFFSDDEETVTLLIFLPSSLSEFALFFWLMIKGVNVEQWEKQMRESA